MDCDDPLAARTRVPPDSEGFSLAGIDPRDKLGLPGRKQTEAGFRADVEAIVDLQNAFHADGRHALLCIFQAMDAGGKDGTVRRVFGPVNPAGVRVTSFKKPSEIERAHDYLWRVHKAVPKTGMIGVFNRSHYEDVLVARVLGLAPLERIEERYAQINDFERHLAQNGVVIRKFYLHISKDEQRQRLQARLDDPAKHWKFNPGDIATRRRWDEFLAAADLALARCSTEHAPWYVVPADRKWVRNAVVARIIRRTIEALDPQYPPLDEGEAGIVIE